MEVRKVDLCIIGAAQLGATVALIEGHKMGVDCLNYGCIPSKSLLAAANAGELILPWGLAIEKNLKIRALADVIVPYPTLSELTKKIAGSFYTPFLFSPFIRKIVQLLMKALP